jgi:hypothetical protein
MLSSASASTLFVCVLDSCEKGGAENETISVTLNGLDSVTNTTSGTFGYRILVLPEFGTLAHPCGVTPADLDTLFTDPELLYIPHPTYFNRVDLGNGSYNYTNGLGQPIGTCTLAQYPGCPDTFLYQIVNLTTNISEYRESAVRNYSVYVDSVPSNVTVSTPSVLFVSLESALTLGIGRITLSNPDQDLYSVRIRLHTTNGYLSWTNVSWVEYTQIDNQTVEAIGTPTFLNQWIAGLQVNLGGSIIGEDDGLVLDILGYEQRYAIRYVLETPAPTTVVVIPSSPPSSSVIVNPGRGRSPLSHSDIILIAVLVPLAGILMIGMLLYTTLCRREGIGREGTHGMRQREEPPARPGLRLRRPAL